MPLPPSSYNHETEPTDLSDHDVELLHHIVLRAQGRHDVEKRPKKALFEAYEAVFAENGIDTRRDRACLRIILQLGEPQIPGDLLYDKFEFVLRQIGVKLAFGDDEPASHHNQQVLPSPPELIEAFERTAVQQASPRKAARRASFTSLHDITVEQLRQYAPRQPSRASESRLQGGGQSRPSFRPKDTSPQNAFRTRPKRQRRTSDQSQNSSRNGMKHAQPRLSHAPELQSRSSELLQIPPERRWFVQSSWNQRFTDSEPESSDEQASSQDVLDGLPHRRLEREADAFEGMRLRNLQRHLFACWIRHSREHLENVRALELQAATKDFLTLKRQAFDFWSNAHGQKRQQRREEHFFDHLYNRAGQAYHLYLVTKSFTHWIQIAAVAVTKTNAARERFLFTKYFNAWYQFTVTNELKAERQGLKKPLILVRKRAAQYYRDQIHGLESYHENLIKYVFWRWFREWCDRAAPRYREQQLRRRTFVIWIQRARASRLCYNQSYNQFVARSLQRIFQLWATKARIDIGGYHQADACRNSRLLGRPFVQWHAEARLRPLEDKLIRMRDWRVTRSNLSIWQLRTRMVLHAKVINRMRILQNAYTAWNEQLRSQAVAARHNERIVAEALYKWVIAQRLALMRRVCEQYQKRKAMRSFLTRVAERWKELSSREEQFDVARKHQLRSSTLGCWRDRIAALSARSQIAVDFYNPKVKQDTIEAIRLKLNEKRKSERWARDARFYFLMTKYITMWRRCAAGKKKARERAAHAKMRRKCKINLARNALSALAVKQRAHQAARSSGEERYEQKMKTLQQILFRDWQRCSSQRQQRLLQGSNQYRDRLLGHSLAVTVDTARHMSNLQCQAEEFYRLKTTELCSVLLRRFSLKAFEIRRREQDADAVHERHWNKHVRNILRHWAGKTQDYAFKGLMSSAPADRPQEREPTDAGYGTASNEDQPQSTVGNDPGARGRAEEWTAFDADLLEDSEWIAPLDEESAATSTPMPAPGYLNTPSKRATRAKVLASLSATPTTPLRTPFAARLRAGMGTSPTQSRATTAKRGGLGFRSALGSKVNNAEEDE